MARKKTASSRASSKSLTRNIDTKSHPLSEAPAASNVSKPSDSGKATEINTYDPDIVIPNVRVGIDPETSKKIFEETLKKEDATLHRLADLQNLYIGDNPNHMEYRPNPYNKRTNST